MLYEYYILPTALDCLQDNKEQGQSDRPWILIVVHGFSGMGSGARVAAAVGMQCRGQIAGYVLMSYPLKVSTDLFLERGVNENCMADVSSGAIHIY